MPTPATPDAVLDPAIAARLKRDAAGLVAAVVQQHDTGEVLMLGWMDDEALRRTLTEGRVTYWSRSRGEYWRKGDTSGHVQHVHSVALDCDGDALLDLAWPVARLAWTLVVGAATGWYPYPFLDVGAEGAGSVAVTCLGVTVLFLALAAGCPGSTTG